MSKSVSSKTKKLPVISINRLAVVLKEEEQTNKWLAEQIGFTQSTVSNWAKNKKQPNGFVFYMIALVLNRNIQDLFHDSSDVTETDRTNHLKTLREITIRAKRTGKTKKKK